MPPSSKVGRESRSQRSRWPYLVSRQQVRAYAVPAQLADSTGTKIVVSENRFPGAPTGIPKSSTDAQPRWSSADCSTLNSCEWQLHGGDRRNRVSRRSATAHLSSGGMESVTNRQMAESACGSGRERELPGGSRCAVRDELHREPRHNAPVTAAPTRLFSGAIRFDGSGFQGDLYSDQTECPLGPL